MADSSNDCPNGSQFYTCSSNNFRGCCHVDPCNAFGCPSGDSGNDADSATTSSDGGISVDQMPTSLIPTSAAATSTSVQSSAAASTSTSSEAPTPLPPPAVSSSSIFSQTTVLITSIDFVSEETVTPTSNGIALAPTQSIVTSTSISSFSTSMVQVAGHPSTPTSANGGAGSSSGLQPNGKSNKPASHSSSNTPAIAGSVGGVVGLVFAAVLIWLLVRWQRSKRVRETRAFQHDDDPRLQGIDANRAGSAFKEGDGVNPYGGGAGAGANHKAKRLLGYSPISHESPVDQHRTTTTTTTTSHLSPSQYGSLLEDKSELGGEAAPSVSELSPAPERSPINSPKRPAVPASAEAGDRAEQSPPAEGPAMQPNLDLATHSPTDKNVEVGGRKPHVMSWMDYDGAIPSPAR